MFAKKLFDGSSKNIEELAEYAYGKLKKKVQPSQKQPSQEQRNDFLREVVKYLNGEIIMYDPIASEIDKNMEIYPNRSFHIKLSPLTSKIRDNFTIAHELGHLFLHVNFREFTEGNDPVVFNRDTSDEYEYKYEWQANRFADAFLMPEKEFRKIKSNTKTGIYDMAEHFQVSVPTIINRLEYLQ